MAETTHLSARQRRVARGASLMLELTTQEADEVGVAIEAMLAAWENDPSATTPRRLFALERALRKIGPFGESR